MDEDGVSIVRKVNRKEKEKTKEKCAIEKVKCEERKERTKK